MMREMLNQMRRTAGEMKPFAVFAAMAAVSVFVASAASGQEFSYENEVLAGVSLNYRMAVINPETETPESVVVYLHGGSAQGSDNEAQLQSQAVDDICDYLKSTGCRARVLAPQAPAGHQWEGDLLPALKALADEYRVEAGSRCYILGGSMGGYGVWNMLSAYPGYFTGAMPVACNTPKTPAENYADERIFSVVGGKDPQRNISVIQTFFSRLETVTRSGAKLDVESGWNHRETCEWSFTPQRLSWLFSLGQTSVAGITAEPARLNEAVYDLAGKRVVEPAAGRVYIRGGKKFLEKSGGKLPQNLP